MTREKKRKTGDAADAAVGHRCRSPIGDFCQKFSQQMFFPLAMALKMVAAWSAAVGRCI